MSSWVHICPGCEGRFRDAQAFLWHTETCDDYAAVEVEASPLRSAEDNTYAEVVVVRFGGDDPDLADVRSAESGDDTP